MNHKFDELTKGLAQSVTRRAALKKLAVGLAATVLAGPGALPASAQLSQLGPLTALSQPNPVAGCDDAFNVPGNLTLNDAQETFVAANPIRPNNLVATWILGHFQNIIAGVTFDGGRSWQQVPVPFTVCSGGPFLGVADQRQAFAVNGDLYVIAVTGYTIATRSVAVTKSTDSGLHWSAPISITGSTYFPNDLPVMVAEPSDARFVYAIWDGIDNGHRGPAVFTRTTDGGNTWDPARAIVPTTPRDYVQFSQLLVQPDGTLVDVYQFIDVKDSGHGIQQTFTLKTIRSNDRGQTWSRPVDAVAMLPVYGGPAGNSLITDPETGQLLDDVLSHSVAQDARGNIYAVWEDGRFSNFQYNDIAFSMSADGGLNWSAPIRINQTPLNIPPANRQAFWPTVALAANGTIGVTHYDFRFNDANPGVPTDYWFVQCSPSSTLAPANPANWGNELRLTDRSFNLEACPVQGSDFWIGDFFGLAAAGKGFISTFTQPDPGNGTSTVFARRIGP